MSKPTINNETRTGRQVALWFGGVISFAYAALIIWMINHPSVCGTHPEGKTLFVGCLTINEIGDFLAGVFAPLAFLWLVIAVIVQSQELSEQRKELALTRKEFEQNREVAVQQAEESKRQAEYIGKQTEILEEGRLRARQEAGDAEISNQVTNLVVWIRSHLSGGVFLRGGVFSQRIDFSWPPSDWTDIRKLAHFSDTFRDAADVFAHQQRKHGGGLIEGSFYKITQLELRLLDLADVKEHSKQWSANFQEIHFERLKESCRQFLDAGTYEATMEASG